VHFSLMDERAIEALLAMGHVRIPQERFVEEGITSISSALGCLRAETETLLQSLWLTWSYRFQDHSAWRRNLRTTSVAGFEWFVPGTQI